MFITSVLRSYFLPNILTFNHLLCTKLTPHKLFIVTMAIIRNNSDYTICYQLLTIISLARDRSMILFMNKLNYLHNRNYYTLPWK